MNRFFSLQRPAEKLVFCVASSRTQAEAVMHRLEAEKFPVEHISVVFPNKGALNLPGIGAYIAAGPLLRSLRGASRDPAAGIAAGLAGLGVSPAHSQRCQQALEEGNFLLSLHAVTDEEIGRAEKIFAVLEASGICHAGEPPVDDFRAQDGNPALGWPLAATA